MGGQPDDHVRETFTKALGDLPDLKTWFDGKCSEAPSLAVFDQSNSLIKDWIAAAENER